MTDAECAAILAEFRKLTLGPELSAALDHAIVSLKVPKLWPHGSPNDRRNLSAAIGGSPSGEVLMNSRAIDLAMA